MPVLYGVFFFMGFSALRGMQVGLSVGRLKIAPFPIRKRLRFYHFTF